ncbi:MULTISPECIES: hypothetical protein [Helicobacter]|uniref:Uncharacterized protein n=2 Tax=Helicobacter TaxID=209 RepID=A0A553UKT6_9HELI|nr:MULTISPECIES: hypothetical protein [Helicobacter]TSA80809.1 hypothetical protein FNE76_07110 [Helicobacter mehlei]CRF45879.1 hypothetical protein HHE014_08580 [Helicobacter heilmannii]CRI35311.1 hypothetical protein HHE01_03090 [Helicobacter heilmannii]BDQ28127.1 hypothetical protein ASB1_18030 [Helicobacter heilmannii]GLH58533.1 hypothetical protein NHP214376_13240 [Helicobacter ailurogastricus]
MTQMAQKFIIGGVWLVAGVIGLLCYHSASRLFWTTSNTGFLIIGTLWIAYGIIAGNTTWAFFERVLNFVLPFVAIGLAWIVAMHYGV